MPPRKKKEEQPVLTLEQKIEKYFEFDQQEKEGKNGKKPLGEELKLMYDKGTHQVGEFFIVRNEQDRSTMNEEKLIQTLKDLGHTEAIATKEIIDQNVVEGLIFDGKIAPEVLQSCTEPKFVQTLQVKKAK